MIDALAFLPVSEVAEGLAYLQQAMPDVAGLSELLAYFDATYVSGAARSVRRPGDGRNVVIIRRSPPLFPPEVWNVHESTIAGNERTNNACEAWNNAFASVVGHHHPSIWTLIECLQMDEAQASTDIVRHARGQAPTKRVTRATATHQRRLQQLCCDRRDDRRTVEDVLRALGHCIRLSV